MFGGGGTCGDEQVQPEQGGTETDSLVLMAKVAAPTPYSLETLQKAVTSEETVNRTELWTTPSLSWWDSAFRTCTFKKKKPKTAEPGELEPHPPGTNQSGSPLYLSVRGGPDDAGNGEPSGTAAQVHCPIHVLLHLRVVSPDDLRWTFRGRRANLSPHLPPQEHFSSTLHLNAKNHSPSDRSAVIYPRRSQSELRWSASPGSQGR